MAQAQYLVVSVALPMSGRVVEATPDKPCLVQKLVLASTRDDGQMYIYTREDASIPLAKMLVEYPLEVLRES